jgi:hypothetical protein
MANILLASSVQKADWILWVYYEYDPAVECSWKLDGYYGG